MARTRWAVRWMAAAVALSALAPAGARAQTSSAPEGKPGKDADVPPAYRPPPGMCRVWLAGVPPTQQPAPTDCASAVRNRPPNGRVLFGDDYVERKTSTGRVFRRASMFWASSGPNPGEPVLVPAAESIPAAPRTAPPRAAAVGGGAARTSQDEYEAGYAAGYRDAMNGRRPRFRGAERADAGTGAVYVTPGAYGQNGAPSGTGAVVVVPPGQDPRYFNNGRYAPPGRANGVCLDRDGDGWCDDPRFGAPVCRDLDGDGRCDDYPELAAAPYPSALPEMRAGLDVQQGRGSATALRWLGTSEVVARTAGTRRAGSPSRVLWFDANTNALLQTWTDLDGDGVADRVEIFRNGRRVKLLGR